MMMLLECKVGKSAIASTHPQWFGSTLLLSLFVHTTLRSILSQTAPRYRLPCHRYPANNVRPSLLLRCWNIIPPLPPRTPSPHSPYLPFPRSATNFPSAPLGPLRRPSSPSRSYPVQHLWTGRPRRAISRPPCRFPRAAAPAQAGRARGLSPASFLNSSPHIHPLLLRDT